MSEMREKERRPESFFSGELPAHRGFSGTQVRQPLPTRCGCELRRLNPESCFPGVLPGFSRSGPPPDPGIRSRRRERRAMPRPPGGHPRPALPGRAPRGAVSRRSCRIDRLRAPATPPPVCPAGRALERPRSGRRSHRRQDWLSSLARTRRRASPIDPTERTAQ